MAAIIELDGVTHEYVQYRRDGDGMTRIPALRDVTLSSRRVPSWRWSAKTDQANPRWPST
jgi:hypothetical protein